MNPGMLDYRLKYGSPCVTSGVTLADAALDADGETRPQGARSCMGAYEYNGATYDSDSDGMKDSWETNYTLNPLNAADAAIDNDGDTYINYSEFIADTDPTASNLYFHVADVAVTGEQAIVTFQSSSACAYSLECLDLPANNGLWSNVVSGAAGHGGMMSLTNASADLTRMYRLKVQRP